MLVDIGIDYVAPQLLQRIVRAFLVRLHQARIARHVSGEDGGKLAFDAFRGQAVLPNRDDRIDDQTYSNGNGRRCHSLFWATRSATSAAISTDTTKRLRS